MVGALLGFNDLNQAEIAKTQTGKTVETLRLRVKTQEKRIYSLEIRAYILERRSETNR